MVLSQADVPSRLSADDFAEGLELINESRGTRAARASSFSQTDEEGNETERVCSLVWLYANRQEARDAFSANKEAALKDLASRNAEFEELPDVKLGTDSFAVKIRIQDVAPCVIPAFPEDSGIESSSVQIAFVQSNSIQSLIASNGTTDLDPLDYVELAERQSDKSKDLLSHD